MLGKTGVPGQYRSNPLDQSSSAQYPASFASPRRTAFCIALDTAGKLYPRLVVCSHFIGWPKSGTGGTQAEGYLTDSLLGEAMGLRPVVLMADVILKTPALKARFGPHAEGWLQLAGQIFAKWDARDCWREVKEGGLWIVPDFGAVIPPEFDGGCLHGGVPFVRLVVMAWRRWFPRRRMTTVNRVRAAMG